mmetsp:Transcript_38069/g.72983  ORF Transcript_38069/g.72983 Transcript_38069/m.72983 type:complete len:240 (-) Transcript_38069:242-961(-)
MSHDVLDLVCGVLGLLHAVVHLGRSQHERGSDLALLRHVINHLVGVLHRVHRHELLHGARGLVRLMHVLRRLIQRITQRRHAQRQSLQLLPLLLVVGVGVHAPGHVLQERRPDLRPLVRNLTLQVLWGDLAQCLEQAVVRPNLVIHLTKLAKHLEQLHLLVGILTSVRVLIQPLKNALSQHGPLVAERHQLRPIRLVRTFLENVDDSVKHLHWHVLSCRGNLRFLASFKGGRPAHETVK